jgi:hypothetical protein
MALNFSWSDGYNHTCHFHIIMDKYSGSKTKCSLLLTVEGSFQLVSLSNHMVR